MVWGWWEWFEVRLEWFEDDEDGLSLHNENGFRMMRNVWGGWEWFKVDEYVSWFMRMICDYIRMVWGRWEKNLF